MKVLFGTAYFVQGTNQHVVHAANAMVKARNEHGMDFSSLHTPGEEYFEPGYRQRRGFEPRSEHFSFLTPVAIRDTQESKDPPETIMIFFTDQDARVHIDTYCDALNDPEGTRKPSARDKGKDPGLNPVAIFHILIQELYKRYYHALLEPAGDTATKLQAVRQGFLKQVEHSPFAKVAGLIQRLPVPERIIRLNDRAYFHPPVVDQENRLTPGSADLPAKDGHTLH